MLHSAVGYGAYVFAPLHFLFYFIWDKYSTVPRSLPDQRPPLCGGVVTGEGGGSQVPSTGLHTAKTSCSSTDVLLSRPHACTSLLMRLVVALIHYGRKTFLSKQAHVLPFCCLLVAVSPIVLKPSEAHSCCSPLVALSGNFIRADGHYA